MEQTFAQPTSTGTGTLSSSVTSGLLTISVHEHLTFDGVELALHPDLFSNVSSMGGVHSHSHSRHQSRDYHTHSRDSSYSSSIISGQTTPMMANTTSSSLITPGTHERNSTPMFANEDGNMFIRSSNSSNNSSSVPSPQQNTCTALQPGNLIEIKVWEEKLHLKSLNTYNQKEQEQIGSSRVSRLNSTNTPINNVVVGAASKLQQQINQQPFPGMYHPLASSSEQQKKSSTSTTTTPTTTSKELPSSSHQSLARPPMAPRNSSNASSAAVSPMHLGPSSNNSSPQPKKTFLLPRWNDSKDSNNLTNSNNSEKESVNVPFPTQISTTGGKDTSLDETSQYGSTIESNTRNEIAQGSSTESPKMTPKVHLQNHDQQLKQQPNTYIQHQQDMIGLISNTHTLKVKFIMSVTEKSLTVLKSSGRTKISLLRQVADLYNISPYDTVTVTKIDKSEEEAVLESVQADHVTLTIKDQFISRGEMYQFQNYFVGKWIYSNKRLITNDGMRGNVMEIRHGGEELKSAFLSDETKITFRSRSARIIWLVQISSEMWDYASPYVDGGHGNGSCEIYFDKFESFMHRLFEEWKALEVTHSLTIIFFSRTYIRSKFGASSETQTMLTSQPEASSIYRDSDGGLYEDFYNIIAENITKTADWESIITKVKKAFVSYPSEVGWKISNDETSSRVPSTAAQGNILEAINTALNLMQLHYIDRDLYRTGNSVVIVSAGSGVFEVDKNLAGITKQRMMDNGIGSDMLSLGLPPLHVAPFFLYKEPVNSRQDERHDFDDWKTFFEIPHWMHLSFVAYDQARPSNILQGKRKEDENMKASSTSAMQQRHLISGRGFEDILEACRPRNRSETVSGMPKALVSQLRLFGLIGSKKRKEVKTCDKTTQKDNDKDLLAEDDNLKNDLVEWGSANFDCNSSPSNSLIGPKLFSYESCSDGKSSPSVTSSNFTNTISSYVLGRSPGSLSNSSPFMSYLNIQQSRSYEMPLFALGEQKLKREKSDDLSSFSDGNDLHTDRSISCESLMSTSSSKYNTGQTKLRPLDAIKAAMDDYDKSVFLPDSSTIHPSQSSRPITEYGGGVSIPSLTEQGSGIGAAILQYENRDPLSQSLHSYAITPLQKTVLTEPTKVTRVKKALASPSVPNFQHLNHTLQSRPTSVGFLPDTKVDATRTLDVTTHTITFGCTPVEAPTRFGIGSMHSEDTPSFLKVKHSKNDAQGTINSLSPKGQMPYLSTSIKNKHSSQVKNKKNQRNQKLKVRVTSPPPQTAVNNTSRRKQWVLNPFRQEDEDEVLSKRNHNSRRWSHVFPQGEIEFKRHAGPNFKSLCQPAILPVKIDVYPTQEEINKKFRFQFYEVNLDAMDLTYYKSHADLLMEMVRQRLVQDFQLVPQSVLMESRRIKTSRVADIYEGKQRSLPSASASNNQKLNMEHHRKSTGNSEHVLSMGHRIQKITHNPTSDAIKVVVYSRNDASNDQGNKARYNFKLWLPTSSCYERVTQTFSKYPDQYNWNGLDNLICGDPDKTLTESTRYRRIMFCIMPESFHDITGEQEYINKIGRFIEFLEKQAQKSLGIKVISTQNRSTCMESKNTHKYDRTQNRLIRFIVHLRKGKREKYEWMETTCNSIWDIKRVFRITFNWLVASSIKIEGQIQLLQRRCTNFGLKLVNTTYAASHSNLYLHPFVRPECIEVPDLQSARMIEMSLTEKFGFCDFGKISVHSDDAKNAFGITLPLGFPRNAWTKNFFAQQYIHKTGTLIIRVLPDMSNAVYFIFLENFKHIGESKDFLALARGLFDQVRSECNKCFQDLNDKKESDDQP